MKIDEFQISPVFVVHWLDFRSKLTIFALPFTKSLCLVLLRPAEKSLKLWLCGNDCSFWLLQAYFTKITNAVGFGEN